jgi:hypothetical protein
LALHITLHLAFSLHGGGFTLATITPAKHWWRGLLILLRHLSAHINVASGHLAH